MERIEISTIKVGERFSKPVFFDDGKYMFIEAGIHVKPYHVAALSKWRIPFLLSDGHIMGKDEILSEEFENLELIELTNLESESDLEELSELEPEAELITETLDIADVLEEL